MELCKTCHTLSQGQTTGILDPLLFIESQALSVAKKLKDLKTFFQDFVCLFEVKHLRHHQDNGSRSNTHLILRRASGEMAQQDGDGRRCLLPYGCESLTRYGELRRVGAEGSVDSYRENLDSRFPTGVGGHNPLLSQFAQCTRSMSPDFIVGIDGSIV